jgi:hypothetical protein
MSQPVFNPFSGPFSEPAGFLPRREFLSDFSAVGENRTPTSFRPLEPESSVFAGFAPENGIIPCSMARKKGTATDGKTRSSFTLYRDLAAYHFDRQVVLARYPEGLAGLTPDELAALAAGDPAGWQSAQARAVALAGGRS